MQPVTPSANARIRTIFMGTSGDEKGRRLPMQAGRPSEPWQSGAGGAIGRNPEARLRESGG